MNVDPSESADDVLRVRAKAARLEIMISSTSFDLPEHRQGVLDAILRMGHHPLAMEHGSAMSDADAISMSLGMVDKADLYIGIFAERYGHKPNDEKRNPHGLSITELEYRRALGQKTPVLRFVCAQRS